MKRLAQSAPVSYLHRACLALDEAEIPIDARVEFLSTLRETMTIEHAKFGQRLSAKELRAWLQAFDLVRQYLQDSLDQRAEEPEEEEEQREKPRRRKKAKRTDDVRRKPRKSEEDGPKPKRVARQMRKPKPASPQSPEDKPVGRYVVVDHEDKIVPAKKRPLKSPLQRKSPSPEKKSPESDVKAPQLKRKSPPPAPIDVTPPKTQGMKKPDDTPRPPPKKAYPIAPATDMSDDFVVDEVIDASD